MRRAPAFGLPCLLLRKVDSAFADVYGGVSFDALPLRSGALCLEPLRNRPLGDFPGFSDAKSARYRGDA